MLPWWLSDKESAYQCRRRRRLGFDPWVGRIPWKKKWQPTPVLLPAESHGQSSLAGYSRGVAMSRTRLKWLSTHVCRCRTEQRWLTWVSLFPTPGSLPGGPWMLGERGQGCSAVPCLCCWGFPAQLRQSQWFMAAYSLIIYFSVSALIFCFQWYRFRMRVQEKKNYVLGIWVMFSNWKMT